MICLAINYHNEMLVVALLILLIVVSYFWTKAFVELKEFRNVLMIGSKCTFKHKGEIFYGVITGFDEKNSVFSIKTVTGNIYEKLITEIYEY